MSSQTCRTCGDTQTVVPDGRGFPPDIAKRALAKRCAAKGHKCDPYYQADFIFGPPIQGMGGQG